VTTEEVNRPDYLLCKSGGQLTFFAAPSVTDLYADDALTTARVHVNG